jgi:hypothetical protein
MSQWSVIIEVRPDTPSAILEDFRPPDNNPATADRIRNQPRHDGSIRLRCRIDAETEQLARRTVAAIFGDQIEWLVSIASVNPIED